VRTALLVLCWLGTTASAEPWYRGEHGNNRILHLSLTTVGFVAYPALRFLEQDVECRWCGGPNAFDAGVRDALVWSEDSKHIASRISDVTAFGLAPGVSVGLVLAGTLDAPSTAALIDDLTPIVETMVVTQWVTRALKIGTGRTRPYTHFTDRRSDDDHLSFPSGHTSRAFAVATSAGMIARARGYKAEPYIWIGGMTLAVASGYFRIAADRHYMTDVMAGAAIGVAAGLTVPLLMRRTNVEAMPRASGFAFSGVW
jgi:membrane-associated phospholipid phosphatase